MFSGDYTGLLIRGKFLPHPKTSFTRYFLPNLVDPVGNELTLDSFPYRTGDVSFERNFLVSPSEGNPLI